LAEIPPKKKPPALEEKAISPPLLEKNHRIQEVLLSHPGHQPDSIRACRNREMHLLQGVRHYNGRKRTPGENYPDRHGFFAFYLDAAKFLCLLSQKKPTDHAKPPPMHLLVTLLQK
jgi:hypothetical protein